MPRRNRVDPWGDLHSAGGRGLFTGNRGCLVDDRGTLVRHHNGRLWITCVLEYRALRQPLAAPRRWTPIFFLDDAVALAAGHRPCGLCRLGAYQSYHKALASGGGGVTRSAVELDRRLASERLHRGQGIERAGDRILRETDVRRLPDGSVIVTKDRVPRLVLDDRLLTFTFTGWTNPEERPRRGKVEVLTPPTSVLALDQGFVPVLHPSAQPRTISAR